MDYESSRSADKVQVNLRGEFTFADNDVFQAMVRDVIDSRSKHIALNFAALEFIDSAALSMLLVLFLQLSLKCRLVHQLSHIPM